MAPSLFSRLYYYKMMFNLQVYRVTEDEDDFLLYLHRRLHWVKRFLFEHGPLHRYYYSAQNFRDKKLFVRDRIEGDGNDVYCTASYRLAQILACEQFRTTLKKEIKDSAPGHEDKPTERIECKFSKSALVEFVTAIQESEGLYVNGQPATQEYLKKRTEHFFNSVLDNFSILDSANRSRKGDNTPFFTNLAKCFNNRAERLDNDNRLKKRRF